MSTAMTTRNVVIKHHHHHHHSHHSHRQQHHQYNSNRYNVLSVFWLMLCVLLSCLPNPVLPEVIYRVDPLALLAATLRTYQRAGCDSEQLSLSCPRGTSISIELAQYGRAGDLSDHSLCPPISQEDLTTTGSAGDSVIHSGTEIEVKPPETCTVSGLQYALLQTVVDACQKKRHCKFAANAKTLSNGDPCSGIRKFVEIAYKCRPYEFRSKVACENDNMPLVCNPYSRIAIYSASFGHIERETVQCGHNSATNSINNNNNNNNNYNMPDNNEDNNNKQTCLVSYATETVMQICHGRRRCSITADAGTFGRPCKNDVRMYLKVVYTCIPRKVLKDRYETAPESDEPQQSELDMDQDDLYDEDQFYKESEAVPPAPKLQGAIPNPVLPFDFNLGGDSRPTSTLLPPFLSHNENTLEEGTTTPITSTVPNGTGDDEDKGDNEDGENVDASLAGWKHFFLRRKCQTEDDWGTIGLNCTEEDMAFERVEVIGFLVNWIEAYNHIRQNQEQFYLYLIISVAAGVLLCLTLVIGRLTLHRRRTCRKNSNASGGNNSKNCSDSVAGVMVGSGGASGKFQHASATGETQLPNSFGDDISEIDADIDLTTPMPVPSLSSRNETYMTYAPTVSCTYGSNNSSSGGSGLPPPLSSASLSSATTMLMPAPGSHHHSGLLMSGHGSQTGTSKSLLGQAGSGVLSRQTPSPQAAQLYASMGGVSSMGGSICSPSVSGTMTMGPHMLTPSTLNTVTDSNSGMPAFITSTVMVPGHHHSHMGTLRRALIPTSIGVLSAQQQAGGPNMPPQSITAMPSLSSGVYYDTTVPRTLARGMSADSTQYFYG